MSKELSDRWALTMIVSQNMLLVALCYHANRCSSDSIAADQDCRQPQTRVACSFFPSCVVHCLVRRAALVVKFTHKHRSEVVAGTSSASLLTVAHGQDTKEADLRCVLAASLNEQ